MTSLRVLAAAACSLALIAGCGGSDDGEKPPPQDATAGKVDAQGRDVAVQPLMQAWVKENVPASWRLGRGEFAFEDITDDEGADSGLDRTRYGVKARGVSRGEFLKWGERLAAQYDDIDAGACEDGSDVATAGGQICAISINEDSAKEFAHMDLFAAWTGVADRSKADTVDIYLEDSPER